MNSPLSRRTALAAAALLTVGAFAARAESPPGAAAPGTTEPPAAESAAAPLAAAATAAEPSAAAGPEQYTAEEAAAAAEDTGDTAPQSYVEAVRAQREARIARMREAREAYRDAWGRDEILKEREAHREAMRNRSARQQEAMRERRRWMNPRGEYLRDMQELRRQAMQAQAPSERGYWESLPLEGDPWGWGPPPLGWSNPWYYRGY